MNETAHWHLVDGDGRVHRLPPTLLFLGREECDIHIQGDSISVRHAVITYDHYQCRFKVKDLGSSNGTFLNNGRICEQVYISLGHGDCLRFGDSAMTYTIEQSQSMLPCKACCEVLNGSAKPLMWHGNRAVDEPCTNSLSPPSAGLSASAFTLLDHSRCNDQQDTASDKYEHVAAHNTAHGTSKQCIPEQVMALNISQSCEKQHIVGCCSQAHLSPSTVVEPSSTMATLTSNCSSRLLKNCSWTLPQSNVQTDAHPFNLQQKGSFAVVASDGEPGQADATTETKCDSRVSTSFAVGFDSEKTGWSTEFSPAAGLSTHLPEQLKHSIQERCVKWRGLSVKGTDSHLAATKMCSKEAIRCTSSVPSVGSGYCIPSPVVQGSTAMHPLEAANVVESTPGLAFSSSRSFLESPPGQAAVTSGTVTDSYHGIALEESPSNDHGLLHSHAVSVGGTGSCAERPSSSCGSEGEGISDTGTYTLDDGEEVCSARLNIDRVFGIDSSSLPIDGKTSTCCYQPYPSLCLKIRCENLVVQEDGDSGVRTPHCTNAVMSSSAELERASNEVDVGTHSVTALAPAAAARPFAAAADAQPQSENCLENRRHISSSMATALTTRADLMSPNGAGIFNKQPMQPLGTGRRLPPVPLEPLGAAGKVVVSEAVTPVLGAHKVRSQTKSSQGAVLQLHYHSKENVTKENLNEERGLGHASSQNSDKFMFGEEHLRNYAIASKDQDPVSRFVDTVEKCDPVELPISLRNLSFVSETPQTPPCAELPCSTRSCWIADLNSFSERAFITNGPAAALELNVAVAATTPPACSTAHESGSPNSNALQQLCHSVNGSDGDLSSSIAAAAEISSDAVSLCWPDSGEQMGMSSSAAFDGDEDAASMCTDILLRTTEDFVAAVAFEKEHGIFNNFELDTGGSRGSSSVCSSSGGSGALRLHKLENDGSGTVAKPAASDLLTGRRSSGSSSQELSEKSKGGACATDFNGKATGSGSPARHLQLLPSRGTTLRSCRLVADSQTPAALASRSNKSVSHTSALAQALSTANKRADGGASSVTMRLARSNRTAELRRAKTSEQAEASSSSSGTSAARPLNNGSSRTSSVERRNSVNLSAKGVPKSSENTFSQLAVKDINSYLPGEHVASLRRSESGRYSLRSQRVNVAATVPATTGSAVLPASTAAAEARLIACNTRRTGSIGTLHARSSIEQNELEKERDKAIWDHHKSYDPSKAPTVATAGSGGERSGPVTPITLFRRTHSLPGTCTPRSAKDENQLELALPVARAAGSDPGGEDDEETFGTAQELELANFKTTQEQEIAKVSCALAKGLEQLSRDSCDLGASLSPTSHGVNLCKSDKECCEGIAQLASPIGIHISEVPGTVHLSNYISDACGSNEKSAFSSYSSVTGEDLLPGKTYSPALSPVRKKLADAAVVLAAENGISQPYNSVILASIQQLSAKLSSITGRLVALLRDKVPTATASGNSSPGGDIGSSERQQDSGDNFSVSSTTAVTSDMPACSQELVTTLSSLRQVEHNIRAVERALLVRSESMSDLASSTVANVEQEQYLAELRQLRNEITGFKPITDEPIGGTVNDTVPTTSATTTLAYTVTATAAPRRTVLTTLASTAPIRFPAVSKAAPTAVALKPSSLTTGSATGRLLAGTRKTFY